MLHFLLVAFDYITSNPIFPYIARKDCIFLFGEALGLDLCLQRTLDGVVCRLGLVVKVFDGGCSGPSKYSWHPAGLVAEAPWIVSAYSRKDAVKTVRIGVTYTE
jgi:hypothetical protein